jgi:hypothetical protein
MGDDPRQAVTSFIGIRRADSPPRAGWRRDILLIHDAYQNREGSG